MRRKKSFFVLSLWCAVVVVVGLAEAQQRVLPTGTPTILPRKAAATPTPAPPSEAEVEAGHLGVELSRIDGATWEIVRNSWRDEDSCLEAVDAHLGQSQGELKLLVRTSQVMECAEDPDSGRMRLRLTTEEARRAFLVTYDDAAVALRSLRESIADEPAAVSVLEAARQKQADWQDLVCRELAKGRVSLSRGRAEQVPNRKSPKSGDSG